MIDLDFTSQEEKDAFVGWLQRVNPLHPKFPAERLAFSGRKNRVRLRGTPLPLRSLPGGAGLVGRTLDDQRAGWCC